MVFTADHFNSPEGIQKMQDAVSLGRFSFSIICCMRCLIIKANGRFLFPFSSGYSYKGSSGRFEESCYARNRLPAA